MFADAAPSRPCCACKAFPETTPIAQTPVVTYPMQAAPLTPLFAWPTHFDKPSGCALYRCASRRTRPRVFTMHGPRSSRTILQQTHSSRGYTFDAGDVNVLEDATDIRPHESSMTDPRFEHLLHTSQNTTQTQQARSRVHGEQDRCPRCHTSTSKRVEAKADTR